MSNQPKYTIKPLNWEEKDSRTWGAISGEDFYTVFLSSSERWHAYAKGRFIGDSETREGAQQIVEDRRSTHLRPHLEPVVEMQATQYLLARGTIIDWPILLEYSIGAGVWFVSHFEMGTMNNKTGEWSTSEPVDSLDYAFRTAGEAAECFYRFNPHLKPKEVQ